MVTIQYWQLAADISLVMALIFLALRFTRSSSSHLQFRSSELQTSLKLLIKEAEDAGQVLNETLIKRQKQLESILADLERANQKAANFDKRQTDLTSDLTKEVDQAKKKIEDLRGLLDQASNIGSLQAASERNSERDLDSRRESAYSQDLRQQYINSQQSQSSYRSAYEYPEPPSFQSQAGSRTETTAAYSSSNSYSGGSAYGIPEQQAKRRSLQESVEREQIADGRAKQNKAVAALENVYDAAEKMLRAGYDLPTVAKQTNLPASELKALSDMLAGKTQSKTASVPPVGSKTIGRESPIFEANEVEHTRDDERLGVLGGIKRQRYTV